MVVKRGTTTLSSGASYIFGETLTVTLSSTSGEYNLQTSGATFTGASCSSTRLANTQGSLVMPSSGSTTVSVLGAWAPSQSTVSISSNFILVPPATTITPTMIPTLSSMPSTIAPTHPTYTPTTSTPTISFAPSTTPTLASTDMPVDSSSASTAAHTGLSVSAPTVNALVGIVVGALGGLALLLSAYAYATRVVSGTLDRKVVNLLIVRIIAAFACLLAIIMIILLYQWSRDVISDDPDTLYLGTPSWSTTRGYFAYHPTLMTSGFLTAQIFAAATWSLGTVREYAKLAHVLFQTAGLTCALVGYIAILEYQARMDSPTLASMHSLVGVCAVAVFGFNYCFGAMMALLTMYHPDCILRQAIDLRSHHKKFGIFAMMLSLAAVLTGVMNVLPMGVCFEDSPGYSLDPSTQYHDLFVSCKLGFGVGICAILAVLMMLWAIADRGESFALTATAAAATISKPVVATVQATSSPSNSSIPRPGLHIDRIEPGKVLTRPSSSTSSTSSAASPRKPYKPLYNKLSTTSSTTNNPQPLDPYI